MILSVTLNPALDHTILVGRLTLHDTNRINEIQTDAGGKGINLSRIIAELGGETAATGFLGGDTGQFIHHTLAQQGVRDEFIKIAATTRINFNIESGNGPPTTLNAKGAEVLGLELENFFTKFDSLCREASWVALSGSIPPGLPPESWKMLAEIAKKHGCKVLIDADGVPMEHGILAAPDLIKPNVKEAERLLDTELEHKRSAIIVAAQKLRDQLKQGGSQAPIAIISRGAAGAIMATPDGVYEAEPLQIIPKSTIGSGDSLLGGFLFAKQLGESDQEALRYGNAAGAATATTNGSEIGRKNVILELLRESKVTRIQ